MEIYSAWGRFASWPWSYPLASLQWHWRFQRTFLTEDPLQPQRHWETKDEDLPRGAYPQPWQSKSDNPQKMGTRKMGTRKWTKWSLENECPRSKPQNGPQRRVSFKRITVQNLDSNGKEKKVKLFIFLLKLIFNWRILWYLKYL